MRALVAATVGCLLCGATWEHQEKIWHFDIPGNNVVAALTALAKKTGAQLLFAYDDVATQRTKPLAGQHTLSQALDMMLRDTGLVGDVTGGGVITISRETSETKRDLEDGMGGVKKKRSFVGILSGILSVGANAQTTAQPSVGMEEIVVTAQRREQSFLEVPISLEIFDRAEISQQGFRDMDDLANFSPTVLVDPGATISQEISIRGFGTTGNALTLEQSVPTFVDGVHYGRTSQIKTAFMDLERVEVLRGPQPVYFGQNAQAGAFNLESRKPTSTWEGYISGVVGNFGRNKIEAAVGGPVTESLGIRAAALYDSMDGYMTDVLTDESIGKHTVNGGRVILQWTPSDSFRLTSKIEASNLEKDPEVAAYCITDGDMIYGPGGPGTPSDEGNPHSVWANPPQGSGLNIAMVRPLDRSPNCFESDVGRSGGGPWFEPPVGIRETSMNTGIIDIREAMGRYMELERGTPSGINGFEDLESLTAYVLVDYAFGNDLSLVSQTAYSQYLRTYFNDNGFSPFLVNVQNRQEDFDQWSQEIRIVSPARGPMEWVAGAFWEKTNNDIFSNSASADVRRGLRFNDVWEEQEWKSLFANVTFNFLDDQFSIDIGARYSQVDKTGFIEGYGSQWVFDVTPCDPGQADLNPLTCPVHPDAVAADPSTVRIFADNVDVGNLWTIPYNVSRDVPSSWTGGRAAAVGLTGKDFSVREGGPYLESISENDVNPQVSLRYQPTSDLSFFVRWAEAFKAGGFDTGQASIASSVDLFVFGPEYSESYEIGARGLLMDGRAQYDIVIFQTDFTDLQLTSATPNPDDANLNLNAGGQRVKGIEVSTAIELTSQARLSIAGALMDGEMTEYVNAGCTAAEAVTAPESGCVLDDPDDPLAGGTIDRTGSDAPRTPNWKFVGQFDYWIPISSDRKVSLNIDGYYSDGYITDVNGFSKVKKYNEHGDLNVLIGFGDQDNSWSVSAFARNIFEARIEYNPEFDILVDGHEWTYLTPNNFRSYGVQLQHDFW